MLEYLPAELFTLVVSGLPSAQDVRSLSMTSPALHDRITDSVWHAFVKARFPSLEPSCLQWKPRWVVAAHTLTTLSRNFDRKSMMAQFVQPQFRAPFLQTQQPRGRYQTMGYQPVIDSLEYQLGQSWHERAQILAWGAGSQILCRMKDMRVGRKSVGQVGQFSWQDHHSHTKHWLQYREQYAFDGRDDITGLRLLKQPYRTGNPAPDLTAFYCTAAGFVSLVDLSKIENPGKLPDHRPGSLVTRRTLFNTGKIPITSFRGVDVNPSERFAVGLSSDHNIFVWDLNELASKHAPTKEAYFVEVEGYEDKIQQEHDFFMQSQAPVYTSMPDSMFSKSWCLNFLSDSLLAVGEGPSSSPTTVKQLNSDGLATLRSFDHVNLDGGDACLSTTYCFSPLPSHFAGSAEPGQVFLSGSSDGAVRLHDMRSPDPYCQVYRDPENIYKVYSLLTHGRERIVVGASNYSMLKFFDLRITGSRSYCYLDSRPDSYLSPKDRAFLKTVHSSADAPVAKPKPQPVASATKNYAHLPDPMPTTRASWNLYLCPFSSTTSANSNPQTQATNARYARPYRSIVQQPASSSPIYSLSQPDPTSPTIFAGIEDAVIQVDFINTHDLYPDARWAFSVRSTMLDDRNPPSSRACVPDPQATWDADGATYPCAMYDMGNMNVLCKQLPVGEHGPESGEGMFSDRDARWVVEYGGLEDSAGGASGARLWRTRRRRR